MSTDRRRPAGIEGTYDQFFDLFGADGAIGLESHLKSLGSMEIHPLMQQFLELLRPRACTTTDAFARFVRLDQFRAEMFAIWQRYDAIVCPPCAVPAILHGISWANWTVSSYCMAYNLTGWPAAVVRAGTSPEGLPIGVQIVARPWREDIVLAVARHIETAFGGWQQPRAATERQVA